MACCKPHAAVQATMSSTAHATAPDPTWLGHHYHSRKPGCLQEREKHAGELAAALEQARSALGSQEQESLEELRRQAQQQTEDLQQRMQQLQAQVSLPNPSISCSLSACCMHVMFSSLFCLFLFKGTAFFCSFVFKGTAEAEARRGVADHAAAASEA